MDGMNGELAAMERLCPGEREIQQNRNESGSMKFQSKPEVPFYLLPYRATVRLLARFELGKRNYGEAAWNAGTSHLMKPTTDQLIERASHAMNHAARLIGKLRGQIPDDGDDDAGAIAWAGMFLAENWDPKKSEEENGHRP